MRIAGIRTLKFLLAAMLLFPRFVNCQSYSNQDKSMKEPDTLQNRQPAVAGQFYPSNPIELEQELKMYFAKAPLPGGEGDVVAIVSPHAGYVFSGEVAAAAFSQVDREKQYKTIFLIGSSHRNAFAGGSVYSIGNYITPLGITETDFATAQKLVSENSVLSFDPRYHSGEHSIEVQVPFLQYWLKPGFKIVPILLGTQDPATCEKIAKVLMPWFTAENLFIISTDFSHYPAYNEAVITDKQISDAILTNQPDVFVKAVRSCAEKKIDNLSTGCCSWPAVITLMYLTQNRADISYRQIMYKNSGDSKYGETDRVVGYNAISVLQEKRTNMILTEQEKRQILEIARNTIEAYLKDYRIPALDTNSLLPALKNKAGAFVTLKNSGQLRGCIGYFEADNALYSIVQKMAVASSTEDNRFAPVTSSELAEIDIEISVLTPMKKISDANTIRLGTDGIYIKKGYRSGTFLPQVATDTGWSLEEFLGHCARDKAGIGWDGWKDKDTELYIYQAFVFGEKE